MVNGAGEGQRICQWIQGLVVVLGGFVGSGQAVGNAPTQPMPQALVWVCAYSDDAPVQCFDTIFESATIVDCGNDAPLDAYDGGSGVMVLTDAMGQRVSIAYGERSYQQRSGPGNLDAIKLFPRDTDNWSFGASFAGDFELCRTYHR